MVSAVIVAAGTSKRMGFDKLSAPICGKPVLQHSIEAFASCTAVDEIVIVAAAERNNWIESLKIDKVRSIVEGGSERHFSVWNGLKRVSESSSLVAIHDGARPLVSPHAIHQCIEVATIHGAASLANPVVDTLKRSQQTDDGWIVDAPVDRDSMWAMQTPQIFSRQLIFSAYKAVLKKNKLVTDEVSAVQELGYSVHLVENTDCNLKITFPNDLSLAEKVKENNSLNQRDD